MATRRKYRKPQGYRDGGVVPPEEMSADVPPSLETIDVPVDVETAADGGSVSAELHDHVRAMLAASAHAEQLQREHQAIEQHIANLPVSEFKKEFLRSNPLALHPQIAPLARKVYQAALASGVPDDSERMNAAMLVGIQREIDGQRQGHSPPPVPDKVAERDVDAAAAELEREAESLRIPKAPEIAPPPSRRSIPVSMPVARDVPTMNGKRMSQSTTVTLSKDEREIAHSAYNWLSKGEAEREYATHKFRMLEARKNGTLNE